MTVREALGRRAFLVRSSTIVGCNRNDLSVLFGIRRALVPSPSTIADPEGIVTEVGVDITSRTARSSRFRSLQRRGRPGFTRSAAIGSAPTSTPRSFTPCARTARVLGGDGRRRSTRPIEPHLELTGAKDRDEM